jgi:hypothetical protein
MMIHGITLDDYLSGDNLLYREVDKDREKLLEEEIKIINKNRKSNIENTGLFESYVELPIFIKIRHNAGLDASYYAKQGSLVPEQTL